MCICVRWQRAGYSSQTASYSAVRVTTRSTRNQTNWESQNRETTWSWSIWNALYAKWFMIRINQRQTMISSIQSVSTVPRLTRCSNLLLKRRFKMEYLELAISQKNGDKRIPNQISLQNLQKKLGRFKNRNPFCPWRPDFRSFKTSSSKSRQKNQTRKRTWISKLSWNPKPLALIQSMQQAL